MLSIFPLLSFLLFSLILTVRIIYLRVKGIRVSPGNRRSWYLLLLYPLYSFLFFIWFYELLAMASPAISSIFPDWFTRKLWTNSILDLIGIAVVVMALFFWALTLIHFKKSLRFGLDQHTAGELITTGVFSYTRNPFFLCVNLFFSGMALLHTSFFFLIMALSALISIHFYILKEEKFLRRHYGEVYRDYSAKVRRYF